MATVAEQSISRSLRTILADLANGAKIADSEQFRDALSSLERFLPEVLGEMHPEWNQESLDGIFPLVARKTRERETEIFGLCILISDQTAIPIHLRLQVSASLDEVTWLECRLGEREEHGMARMPYQSLHALRKRLYALKGKTDMIDWAYKVTFGDGRL